MRRRLHVGITLIIAARILATNDKRAIVLSLLLLLLLLSLLSPFLL
jgi:hypothetical protein